MNETQTHELIRLNIESSTLTLFIFQSNPYSSFRSYWMLWEMIWLNLANDYMILISCCTTYINRVPPFKHVQEWLSTVYVRSSKNIGYSLSLNKLMSAIFLVGTMLSWSTQKKWSTALLETIPKKILPNDRVRNIEVLL